MVRPESQRSICEEYLAVIILESIPETAAELLGQNDPLNLSQLELHISGCPPFAFHIEIFGMVVWQPVVEEFYVTQKACVQEPNHILHVLRELWVIFSKFFQR